VLGADQRDERKRTADEVSKEIQMTSKLVAFFTSGLVQGKPVYCLNGVRHKGGMNLIQAFVRNVGNCRPDAKGRNSSGSPMRMSVPTRGTEAEQSVVAIKVRNGTGAKGLHCPALLDGQPYQGGTIE
jgi:hypothetical protein